MRLSERSMRARAQAETDARRAEHDAWRAVPQVAWQRALAGVGDREMRAVEAELGGAIVQAATAENAAPELGLAPGTPVIANFPNGHRAHGRIVRAEGLFSARVALDDGHTLLCPTYTLEQDPGQMAKDAVRAHRDRELGLREVRTAREEDGGALRVALAAYGVEPDQVGARLDRYVAERYPDHAIVDVDDRLPGRLDVLLVPRTAAGPTQDVDAVLARALEGANPRIATRIFDETAHEATFGLVDAVRGTPLYLDAQQRIAAVGRVFDGKAWLEGPAGAVELEAWLRTATWGEAGVVPDAPNNSQADHPGLEVEAAPGSVEAAPTSMDLGRGTNAGPGAGAAPPPETIGGPGLHIAVDDNAEEYWEKYYDDGYGSALVRDVHAAWESAGLGLPSIYEVTRIAEMFAHVGRVAQAAPALAKSLLTSRSMDPGAGRAVDQVVLKWLARTPGAIDQLGPSAYQQLLQGALASMERENPKQLESLRMQFAPELDPVDVSGQPSLWQRMKRSLPGLTNEQKINDAAQGIEREMDMPSAQGLEQSFGLGQPPKPPGPRPAPALGTPSSVPPQGRGRIAPKPLSPAARPAPGASTPSTTAEVPDWASKTYVPPSGGGTDLEWPAPLPREPRTEPGTPNPTPRPPPPPGGYPVLRPIPIPEPAPRVLRQPGKAPPRSRATPPPSSTSVDRPRPTASRHEVWAPPAPMARVAVGDPPVPEGAAARPNMHALRFRVDESSIELRGGYVRVLVLWDADKAKGMPPGQVKELIKTCVKARGVNNDKNKVQLGIIGGFILDELDLSAGLAEVRFRASNGPAGPEVFREEG